jgi:hypothetical protein
MSWEGVECPDDADYNPFDEAGNKCYTKDSWTEEKIYLDECPTDEFL